MSWRDCRSALEYRMVGREADRVAQQPRTRSGPPHGFGSAALIEKVCCRHAYHRTTTVLSPYEFGSLMPPTALLVLFTQELCCRPPLAARVPREP